MRERHTKRRKKWGLLRRVAAMSLAMVLCLSAIHVVHPEKVEAQAAENISIVYIQTSVDTNLWKIVGAVVHESLKDSLGGPGARYDHADTSEARRGIGSLSTIADPLEFLNSLTPEYQAAALVSYSAPILVFPNGTIKDGLASSGITTLKAATNEDEATAIEINNTLTNDLNEAFLICNGGSYTPTGSDEDQSTQYRNDLVVFLTAVGQAYSTGTTVTYAGQGGTTATISKGAGDGTVVVTVNGEAKTFTYQMEKKVSSGNTGATFINWDFIVAEAFANYWVGDESLQVTPGNLYESAPSSFESILVDLFQTLVNWIKSALGLWNIDDLVFNFGNRQAPTYVNGLFPSSWESVIWVLFFIMEVLAFIILAIVLVSNIIRKAMSTINPVMRVSLMDQAKDLIVVAFILGCLPLIIQLLTNLSATLTGVFGAAMGGDGMFDERFSNLSHMAGGLGGVIMQILYLAITISFNVMYAIRSYLLAALIIMSPLCVIFYAVGDDNKKGLCKMWLSEFLSNIFVQPIHAFILAVVLLLPGSSRPIEGLVTLYCVMPLAGIIQRIFFGSAGGSVLGIAPNGIRAARNNFNAAKRDAGLTVAAVGGAAHFLSKVGPGKNKSSGESDSGAGGENGGDSGGGRSPNNGGESAGSEAFGTRLNGMASRMSGQSGDKVYASKQPTPREQFRDEIGKTGIAPSVGVVNKAPTEAPDGLDSSKPTSGEAAFRAKQGIGSSDGVVPASGQASKVTPPINQAGKVTQSLGQTDKAGVGPDTLTGGRSGSGQPVIPERVSWHFAKKEAALQPTGRPSNAGEGRPITANDLSQTPEGEPLYGLGQMEDGTKPLDPMSQDQEGVTIPWTGQGSDLSDVLRSVRQPDGSIQYQASRQDMKDIGFATYDGTQTGAAYTTTDTGYRGITPDGRMRVAPTAGSIYSPSDAKNLGQMARVFERGTDAQKDLLRRAGYEYVAPEMRGQTPTGRFAVHTNQNFDKAMGYQFRGSNQDKTLSLHRQSGASGEMRRTPDVGRMMDQDAYLRYTDTAIGYTAAGIRLGNNDTSRSISTIPLSKEAQRSDGSYQISAEALRDQGISVSKTEDGRSAVTYQAGILGKDQDGATVYDQGQSMMPCSK